MHIMPGRQIFATCFNNWYVFQRLNKNETFKYQSYDGFCLLLFKSWNTSLVLLNMQLRMQNVKSLKSITKLSRYQLRFKIGCNFALACLNTISFQHQKDKEDVTLKRSNEHLNLYFLPFWMVLHFFYCVFIGWERFILVL